MKKAFRAFFLVVLKTLFTLVLISICWVFLYRYINPPISGMMFYKWVTQNAYSYEYEWVDLEEVSPYVPIAFIAAEDQVFLTHNGFDVKAIEQAIQYNKRSKRKRGASTISQQVAKNTFLIPTKSFLRKGIEAYFTILIELIWGKERIMEVYINIVELGEGTFGIGAASSNLLKLSPKRIDPSQAALIATTLPNPLVLSLVKPSEYMLKRQTWIMKQMNNLGGKGLTKNWYE